MRHLPGCRTVNSLVDSAEQLTLFSSAGDVDTYRATQGARKFMDFFYLSDSNRCHKTKIRLKKKKSVYTTKTYFTTDQRYLLQRATQHKKSLHIQQQHGNMLTCLNVSKSRQDSHKLEQKLKNKELWHLNYVSFYLKLLSESSRKSTHVKKKKKIHHILCIYAGLSHSASVLW